MNQLALFLITIIGVRGFSAPMYTTPAPDTQIPEIIEVPQVTVTEEPVYTLERVQRDDWVQGAKGAPISIITWVDFECPFCKTHHQTLAELQRTFGTQVNVVYRHFPLSFHANAYPSANAAECAGALGGPGAFWQFADAVFTSGAEPTQFVDYARNAGVSIAAFNDCVKNEMYSSNVDADLQGGTDAGVFGTPASFVVHNATGEYQMISGAQPADVFTSTIQALLAQ